jgi:hypothetical protein
VGVAYNVVSADGVDRYPFAVACLRHFDMVPPPSSGSGRNPSPRELRTILDDLPGHAAEYHVSPTNWQATVVAKSGLWLFRANTLVSVVDYRGDEALPHLFYFEGDAKLNILIAEGLSRLCGPLYLFPDTGAQPVLVTPGIDPAEAVRVWESA